MTTAAADGRMTKPPLWAILGTIVFTVVVPGTVVVFVPYLLSEWTLRPAFLGTPATRVLGLAMILAGLPLLVDFLMRFVREGRGTPAPVAPTEKLVVHGPYRFVRNPGYIAVLAMVMGQGLLLASRSVLGYGLALTLGFHLFVLLYEEPTLRASFGREYEEYSRSVPRWIPRLRRG